jgi:hypothetical protein
MRNTFSTQISLTNVKVDFDVLIDNEIQQRLLPKYPNEKAKIRLWMEPRPTLRFLRKEIERVFANIKGISYDLRFAIPLKVSIFPLLFK